MAKGSKKGVQNDHFFGTFGIRMAKGVKKGGHFWTPFWTPYVPNSPLKCVNFDQKGVQKGVQKVVKKWPKKGSKNGQKWPFWTPFGNITRVFSCLF